MKKRLSLKEAKRLSILKWELIVANNGDSELNYPVELSNLPHHCGFCSRWTKAGNCWERDCDKCECVEVFGGVCNSDYSDLYSKWCNKQTKENAQKILSAIKSIKVPKWYNLSQYFKKQ